MSKFYYVFSSIEMMWDYCSVNNIHECCLCCKKECKQPYTYWSGQMPANIYCEDWEDAENVEVRELRS